MKTTVNTYRIYIKSNKNPRTCNTPMLGRVNYEIIQVEGATAMYAKVAELRAAGEHIIEIRAGFGGRKVYV